MKEKRKIGDCFYVTDFVANGSFASLRENVQYINEPDYAVLVRTTDNTKNWNGNYVYVSKESFHFLSKSVVYPGDLIISNVGEPGIAFIVPDLGQPMTLGPNSILVRPQDKSIDINYIYYLIKSPVGKSLLDKIVSKTTIRKFNKTDFRSLELPIPPLEEQKHIAAVLSKAESMIAERKQSMQLLDEYLKSTFLEMFIYNSKNNSWTFTEIKNVVEKDKHAIKAGPFGSSLKKEFYVSKGYKIYGQEQVIKDDLNFGEYYINEELYKKLESCKVKEGDVLISLVGTYGKLSVIPKIFEPGIINPRLMKISFDKSLINTTYFKHLFRSDYLLQQLSKLSRGGTMDIINVGIVKDIKIPVPPLTLQTQFAKIVEKTEALKTQYKEHLQELEQMYGALSQRAFRNN